MDTYKRTVESIRGELYNNGQLIKLFDTFVNFLKVHKVNSKQILKILTSFKNGEYIDSINKGVTWSDTEQGYDFFYFLALRWATYLIRYAKLYDKLYTVGTAWDNLSHLYHFTDYIDFVDYSSSKNRKYYEHFLEKREK